MKPSTGIIGIVSPQGANFSHTRRLPVADETPKRRAKLQISRGHVNLAPRFNIRNWMIAEDVIIRAIAVVPTVPKGAAKSFPVADIPELCISATLADVPWWHRNLEPGFNHSGGKPENTPHIEKVSRDSRHLDLYHPGTAQWCVLQVDEP